MIENLSFIFFVTLLGLLYITNANNAEKNLRKIEKLKKEVKEAKFDYMKVQQEIVYPTTESELAKNLESDGFKVNKSRPIVLKPKEDNKK